MGVFADGHERRIAPSSSHIPSEKAMNPVDPSAAVRAFARRYRQTEDAGFPDLFLIVVSVAGSVAIVGVALLAFVPTHAVLALAYVLVIATTLSVLLTALAMVAGEERASDPSEQL
jgi:hypothetical protein